MQILLGERHGQSGVHRGALPVEIQPDEGVVPQQKDQQSADQTQGSDPALDAECVLKALQIVLPVVLGAVDARAGESAENRQVEHKDQLARNGNGGHRLRPLTSYHDVVHQTHHVGDAVLDHHGNGQLQCPFIDLVFHNIPPMSDVLSQRFRLQ